MIRAVAAASVVLALLHASPLWAQEPAQCSPGDVLPCYWDGNLVFASCTTGRFETCPGEAQAQALCASSEECREDGRCTLVDGECAVGSSSDCRASELCTKKGRCEAYAGECVAASASDCLASELCTENHKCVLDAEEQRCGDGTKRRSTGAMVAGLTVIGAGGVTAIAGGILALSGGIGTCRGSDFQCTQTPGDQRDLTNGGIIAGVGLGTLLLVGVPLTVYGATTPDVAVALELAPAGGRVSLEF